MRVWRTWQFRVSRLAGRFLARSAAVLTLGRMPPFVSASAVVLRRDDVLVVIDPIRNEPVLPGGHLKWAERPERAVVREVKEETGYEIEPERLIGVFAGPEWAGEDGIVRVIFAASITSGILRSSAEGRATWMPVRDLVASGARDAPIVQSAIVNRPG
ncbi:MAG TPA: NUDIX hydrolase [Chloroflexota bacterium]|nr:NUDIX hydrolase [Chloroflexota bacterium]